MKKFDRLEAFVAGLGPTAAPDIHPCYSGYFTCFNRGEYYEAHDVLEHLWLQDRHGPDGHFYKGLIQLAGGFVHLRKQFLRPHHPKDGRRLAPAARLFDLAAANLAPFAPHHRQIDVARILSLAESTARQLRRSDFQQNPWSPETRPHVDLSAA